MYGRKRRFGALLRREFPEYNKRYLKYIRTGAGRHGLRRSSGFAGFKQRRVHGIAPRALMRTGGLLPYPSNIERKFFDVALTDDATSTPSLNCVNAMVAGTSAVTRIGRRIVMKSLQIRGLIYRENAATTTNQFMRLVVVFDRQPNGSATVAPWTDMYNTATPHTLKNMANAGRFFTLMDKNIDITAANGGNTEVSINEFIKFNLPVYYNAGVAGNVADISTGALLVCYVGSQAAGTDDINVELNCRLRYTDM